MEDVYYEKIYNYLSNQLSAAEEAAFEQQLETDAQLAEDLAFHRQLIDGVNYAGDQELAEAIQQSHEQARERGLLLTEHHIMAYLKDELDDEQAERLERRMAAEESFAEEMAFNQTLLEGVSRAGDEDLQQSIKATHQKMKEGGHLTTSTTAKVTPLRAAKTRSLFSARAIAIAASFLLLLAVGLYLFLPSGNTSGQLYASYFQIDENQLQQELERLSFTGMAISDKARRESLSAALELFQNSSYEQATDSLAVHMQQFPTDETARLYYGISLMETEDFVAAITALQPVSDNSESSYQADARWYQALSYLQTAGGRDAAVELLRSLQSEEKYGVQAQQLLNELE